MNRISSAGTALALFLCATAASAPPGIHTGPVVTATPGIYTSPVLTAGPFGTDAPGGLINLPLFNSCMGTLESVSVRETGTFTGGANLVNNGHMPDSFSFNIGGAAGVDNGFSSDPSAAAADLKALKFNTSMPTKSFSLAKSATGVYGPFTVKWGNPAITNLPVAHFERPGGGTVAIHIDATSFPVDTPKVIELNDVFYSEQNLRVTAQMQVTYHYTPFATPTPCRAVRAQ